VKLDSKRLIPYLIVIVPLLLVLSVSFFMTTFYINKVKNYFEHAKINSMKEYIETQKAESKQLTKQLVLLFEYSNNRVVPSMKEDLKKEVDIAYAVAQKIYKKYKNTKSKKEIQEHIKEALSEMTYNDKSKYIFLTNFNAEAILHGSHLAQEKIALYQDADHRSIVLEEIQKVRKHGEGFLESRRSDSSKREIIYVKDLGIYGWYIGSSSLIESQKNLVKLDLLAMIKSIPVKKSNFIGVYEEGKKLYLSDKLEVDAAALTKDEKWHKHQLKDYYYFSKYYAPFKWTLVYGFNTRFMSTKAKEKQKSLDKMLAQEYSFIVKVSAFIIFIIVLLSLFLSIKVNKIFKSYQKEVQMRESALEELNESLEQRVQEEVYAHREKDKLLTQSAKMAEMGDMLSMIAHQWRQPLNQISYVIMNLESAYEFHELTEEYMQSKVKEANELLEFMSVTIDDFKNYFKPDKEQEEVVLDEVVQKALSLLQKTLKSEGIEVVLDIQNTPTLKIYRNEFIQVLLNLLKNARDVLNAQDINEKKITISIVQEQEYVLVKVCDNGGGVAEETMEKIFDPYFSTKDASSGTGLGLYMSKMIIESHLGAKLSVVNEKEGACFRIQIALF